MEYHKTIKLLDNASNQSSKFRTKKWVEVNEDMRRICSTNSQIKFKNTMLNSSFCD